MHQGFHGLVGGLVRLPPSCLGGVAGGFLGLLLGDLLEAVFPLMAGQVVHKLPGKFLGLVHVDPLPQVLLHVVHQGLHLVVRHAFFQLNKLNQSLKIFLGIGLIHALGHGVIEVGHALAAVHLVLVGLNGNAGQGRIAGDGVGLPQIAVACGEAVVEQLDQVDLAAGLRQGVEILVVDVNLPLGMGLGDVGRDDVLVVKALSAFGAVLEHGAHGGVGVDVGVLPL